MLFLLFSVACAQRCFSLAGSTQCKDMEKAFVIAFANVTDVASFDSFVGSAIADSSPSSVQKFQSTYRCPGYTGRTTRFRLSTLCYYMVQQSATQCKQNPLPLCKKTCQGYLDSVSQTFQNPQICEANPPADVSNNRRSVVQTGGSTASLSDYCGKLADTGCSDGVKSDFASCGFAFREDAISYCKGKTEACCSQLSTAGSSGGSSAGVAVGITIGVLILVIIGYVIVSKVLKNNKKDSEAGYQNSPPNLQKSTADYQNEPRGTDYKENSGSVGDRVAGFISSIPYVGGFFKKDSSPKNPVPLESVSTHQKSYVAPQNSFYNERNNRDTRASMFTSYRGSDLFNGSKQTTSVMPKSRNTELMSSKGKRVQVFEDYDAVMDDEISAKAGDVIAVQDEYDDGKIR
jgi:hypothetical protein